MNGGDLLASKPLTDLVQQLRTSNSQDVAQAEGELYRRTIRFVQMVVRQSRADKFRNHLTTEWLANAIEKSFLSYVKKKQWQESIPQDPAILSILATITKRAVIRELARLSNEPLMMDIVDKEIGFGPPDGTMTPDEVVAFVEFLENFKNRVRESSPEAISILDLMLEGYTPAEIREELGMERGKLYHNAAKLRKDLVLAMLEPDQPDAVRAFKMHDDDETNAVIAETLSVSTDWVQNRINMIKSMLGKR